MARSWTLGVFAVGIAAVAMVVLELRQTHTTQDSLSSSDVVAPQSPAVTLKSPDPSRFLHPEKPRHSIMDVSTGSDAPMQQPGGRPTLAESVAYFEARSKADAVWLKANGYPTEKDLSDLQHTTLEELAARALKGDLAAQAMLARKQFAAGQVLEGHANLQDAAIHGSVYAVHLLADRMAEKGNQAEAMDWFQVAGMRGDYSASDRLAGLGWQPINPFAIGRSQRYALRYFENLSAERARLGLGPFVNRLRPGANDRTAKPGEYVAVYEPPSG